jgi:hypothetical protein
MKGIKDYAIRRICIGCEEDARLALLESEKERGE